MKLTFCCNLTTTPDFSEIGNLEELNLKGCVNLVDVHPSIGMLGRLVKLNLRGCKRLQYFPSKQHPRGSVSLAGLRMLMDLDLSDCDLLEVSESIGGLSRPNRLYLQGNKKLEMLPSLSQLSHLQILVLDGCKKLEVLPELPHSLEITNASDCTSLCSVTGSNPITSKRTRLRNCPKLFKNLAIDSQVSISETQSVTSQGSTNRFSSFLRYARIQNNRRGFFRLSSIKNIDIIYDGNSIPNYFTNRRMGNHIKVELPLDWSFSKLRGYGICVVFKRKKPYTSFGYDVTNFDGDYLGRCSPYYYHEYFKDKPIRIDESDMIWLHYTTTEIQKLKEAKNFVTFCFFENEGIEVKKMRVRLVFDEDLDQEAADSSMFQDVPILSQHSGALCLPRGDNLSMGWNRIEWSW